MLQSGAFQWANTATLSGVGIVDKVDGQWQWNPAAFDENGDLVDEYVTLQDPTSENCSQCHGLAHVDSRTPLVISECEPAQWSTITTGQIFSPQRIADSGANFQNKDELSRSWDVHAESVLDCADCHYSLNNPVYFQESDATRPDHLTFDPRRIDLGEYLYRPLHQFAKGENMQSSLAPELDNSLRRCESCHDMEAGHDWLPYREAHAAALDCESCHIPKVYGPARQYNDWTVLTADGAPQTSCRGLDSEGGTFGTALITGFEPVLLPRENGEDTTLAPYNLITSWFWVYGDPERPVPYRELQAAWFENGAYRADILSEFDGNNDRQLDSTELVIDTEAKESLIAAHLEARGLSNAHIVGSVQPYGINHNVAYGEWAIRDCETCHSDDSRIGTPMVLANRLPGGVIPTFVSNSSIDLNAGVIAGDDSTLSFQPRFDTEPANIYIFGLSSVSWVDWFGVLMFLGTLVLVSLHGGIRYRASRRNLPHDPELRRVYMYSVYERQWHWLQTVVILGLIFTGLIIHKPDMFGIFSFRYVVEIHNILAAILVINAALAAFYHLVSGEIRQYLPQPRGFFNQAFEQTLYYVRGIFRGDPHPMQKTRDRKLNPLQQITYFAILNVLLPLQVITGALIWGAQQWPDIAASLGGLPFLAPFHTLIAWSFASFIVAHVYLTTTAGHTATAGIKAMIMGWDEVEVKQKSEHLATTKETVS
jgi:thiosulfate reductase cytochrome b subunit